MPESAYVRWFTDLRADAWPLVGGKNAGLGELLHAGLRVPAGFALTTHAYECFLERGGIRWTIQHTLAAVDPEDTAGLEAASGRVRRLIEETPLPAEVEAEVLTSYADLARHCRTPDPPVAVRSSATGEDSAQASFAGQQETYLWVQGGRGVAEHTRRCWSSLYTPQAIAYRARMGVPNVAASMSVGVQQMVDARVAGVLFTLNPLNGDRSKIVVEASWGLGVSVVGGEVTPDEYWVDKVTLDLIRRTISPKTTQYLPAPRASGVTCEPVPADLHLVPCLRDEEVVELARLGKLVEQHHGAPRDIEWAIDRYLPFPEGVLLLQSRPETVWTRREAVPIARPRASSLEYVTDVLLGASRSAASRAQHVGPASPDRGRSGPLVEPAGSQR